MTRSAAARSRIGVAALLALTAALAVHDLGRDSATADEPIHVAASASLVRDGTWSVNVEQPPLAKALFGAVALEAGFRPEPPLAYRDLFRTARAQLFGTGAGRSPDRVLRAARLVTVGFLLVLVGAAAGAAGGGEAGLLAAALVAGQTAFVPHGHLVTTDVPAAALSLLALWGALAFYERPRPLPLLLSAASLAAALATKQSAVAFLGLLPLLGVPAFLRAGDRQARLRIALGAVALPLLAVAGLALLLAPWVASDPPGTTAFLVRLYGLAPADRDLVLAVERGSRGLGRYLLSSLFVLRQTEAGRAAFFLGEVWQRPPALYHLVALVTKSPLPWLLAVTAGGLLAARRGAPPRARLLLAAGAVLFLVSLPGPRIGVRHVLSPAALLTCGAAVVLAPAIRKRGGALALAATALVVLAPLAGGRSLGSFGLVARAFPSPPVADSNLDWGQDLLRLRDLLKARGIRPEDAGVAYFGGDSVAYRIPGAVDLLESDAPLPRHVAVSRQLLLTGAGSVLFADGRPRAARLLATLAAEGAKPVARAGDSIELFDLARP